MSDEPHMDVKAIGVAHGGETQRATLDAYCKDNGFTLTTVFACETQRQEAIEEACANRALLVAEDLTCLANSILDLVRLGIRLKEAGAQLVLLDPEITPLTSSTVLQLLASMGNLEYHRLGDPLPYGYEVADDLEHIVVNPAEMDVIHRIVGWHSKDVALDEIADRLNAESVPARRAETWTCDAVREIIESAITSRWDGLA